MGELLVDSAEMDDVSGLILMALLFAIALVIQGNTEVNLANRLIEEHQETMIAMVSVNTSSYNHRYLGLYS